MPDGTDGLNLPPREKKKRIKDHHSMEITSCCFFAPLHFYWKIKEKSLLILGFLVSLKMKHLTLSLVQ